MARKPLVSVVIPAYNEATYIDRLLAALTKQNYKDFEVIVSDAQSKDGTDKVVKSFENKLNIKFLEAPPKGPAYGRNVGAKLAKSEWLLFLDADIDIDDPDFISKLLNGTELNNWQTATAAMKAQNPSLLERLGTWLDYRYIKLLAHTKRPVAPGYCILTKRDIFDKNSGFNEKIKFGEDYDYVTRTSKWGFGFITDTLYYVDMRRYRDEGILFAIKTIINEIYRFLPGHHLERNPVKYEFGKHRKRR
jgi:glycosyltransferase involved in cell wall biosynthesis